MRDRSIFLVMAGFGFCGLCFNLSAQGRGEGGIVLTDEAPIYSSSEGGRHVATAMKGDEVGGQASLMAGQFYFSEKNGRVQVIYYDNIEQVGLAKRGWIDPKHLSVFSYDCSCGGDDGCLPTRLRGLRAKITMSSEWNTCFKEARDAHRLALAAQLGGEPSDSAEGAAMETKTVELAQTIEEVESILGAPEKILNAGSKIIYVYPDLKVIFMDGLVTDLQ